MKKIYTILLAGMLALGARAQLTSITNVNVGSAPSAGDGDPARTAFQKINTNFIILSNLVAQLPAANLTGTVPLAQLPNTLVSNNGPLAVTGAAAATINGAAILTNGAPLSAANLTGTVSLAQLPGGVVTTNQSFPLMSTFGGVNFNPTTTNHLAPGSGSSGTAPGYYGMLYRTPFSSYLTTFSFSFNCTSASNVLAFVTSNDVQVAASAITLLAIPNATTNYTLSFSHDLFMPSNTAIGFEIANTNSAALNSSFGNLSVILSH
ncbi:MAG: hypothetical protein KGL39_54020 [Patescibacteria group bacterium]|nr:hypothetical protein [Patescibacteria group bacterium]